MTATERDLTTLVKSLTPALKTRQAAPKRFSRAQRRDLSAAIGWNSDGNIVGFGVGPKRTSEQPDYKRHSLIVFVVKKLAKSKVAKDQLIPRRISAECVERQLSTDIVEVGQMPMLQATVLRPGANAAHFSMRDGSITAVVTSRGVPKLPFLLSCCHVFAPPQSSGRQVESPPDPSAITFTNHVADVAAFQPLHPGGNIPNQMDAALAAPILSGPGLSNDIPGVGRLSSTSRLKTGEFLPNGIRQVFGVGAVTGRVQGDIVAENVATLLADPFGRRFLFQNIVAYRPTPVTQPGDSGMPILMNGPAGLQLLGMHIGLGQIGNTSIRAAFFVPIAPVLDRFGVNLIT